MTGNTQVQVQWGLGIPMRDGVRLHATLYRPVTADPRPAIMTLTPYVAQTYHERGTYFASHGYPFLAVDVRGRGNSEGAFWPNLNEGADGCDAVEWIARQPFCDGHVAMWGGSYAGHDQWTTAARFPPHLATIVPAAAPYIGVDFPIRNNIAAPYWVRWLMLVAGRTSQDRVFADESFWNATFLNWAQVGGAFRDLDRFVGHPSRIFQEWASHPAQDAYWDKHNPTPEQYARLSIPVLTITGIYDDDQLGALTHYRLHKAQAQAGAKHCLVIGPWDHAGTRTPKREFAGISLGEASLVDLPKLHLEWYDWTMRSGPRPAFLERDVAYYVLGAERWRHADSLEAITQSVVPLFLDSAGKADDPLRSGSLVNQLPTAGGFAQYVYDPRDLSLAALESGMDPESKSDQRLIYAGVGRQLVYHGAPLEADVEVSGFFSFRVWIGIDQPDTDFRVAVYDVGIDGSAVLLTSDTVRARYRESSRDERLVGSSEAQEYLFDRFTFVSRLVRAGHRLRVVIGPNDSIHAQRNYNSGGVVADETSHDTRVVTVRLFHGGGHPSALFVPLAG